MFLCAWTSFTTSESEKWNNESKRDKREREGERKEAILRSIEDKMITANKKNTTIDKTTKVIANVNRKRDAHYLYSCIRCYTAHIRANKPCSRIEWCTNKKASREREKKKWNDIYQPMLEHCATRAGFAFTQQNGYLVCCLLHSHRPLWWWTNSS